MKAVADILDLMPRASYLLKQAMEIYKRILTLEILQLAMRRVGCGLCKPLKLSRLRTAKA